MGNFRRGRATVVETTVACRRGLLTSGANPPFPANNVAGMTQITTSANKLISNLLARDVSQPILPLSPSPLPLRPSPSVAFGTCLGKS